MSLYFYYIEFKGFSVQRNVLVRINAGVPIVTIIIIVTNTVDEVYRGYCLPFTSICARSTLTIYTTQTS